MGIDYGTAEIESQSQTPAAVGLAVFGSIEQIKQMLLGLV